MAKYFNGLSEVEIGINEIADTKVDRAGDVLTGNLIWSTADKGPVLRSPDGTLFIVGTGDDQILTTDIVPNGYYGYGGEDGNLSEYI